MAVLTKNSSTFNSLSTAIRLKVTKLLNDKETMVMMTFLKIGEVYKKKQLNYRLILYCIHTKKLSCLKSGAEFYMNDILNEFKNLHHF